MRTLIVGHGGRESALARRMGEHSELHALIGHENPSIVAAAEASGGGYATGDVRDPRVVAAFAREREVEIAMVSADEPLAAGVVDALLAQGTRAVGPTRAGAEIEWNKVFARELLAEVAPEAAPMLRVVSRPRELDEAIASFGATPVAVKPSGLTGGKGVKVMGPHLADHAQAGEYAKSLLAAGGAGETVLIEEKVLGAEFTIQAVSDGRTVVFPPATYDYPYRYDGDEGPGTGGMGSLSMAAPTLPFMTDAHYRQACSIIERVIERLADEGRHFSGVMNSGFFATADGVKVIEFNARFGDPECMNIMSLFAGSWPETMEHIASATLTAGDVALRDEASLVLYLVSPDYALRAGPAYEFELDVDALAAGGCEVHFASAVRVTERTYRTVGTSRAVALACTRPTLEQARAAAAAGAATVPVLEWRRDVGDTAYLEGLRRLVAGRGAGAERPDAPGQRLARQSA
ncbi:MAG TPA: phosphoribosylamine--glycine ligase [Solirubrobacteraceae bacterium]|nr:phosphoribosylamine--glycine ligase [Solirubrobacteraceae bacterium]